MFTVQLGWAKVGGLHIYVWLICLLAKILYNTDCVNFIDCACYSKHLWVDHASVTLFKNNCQHCNETACCLHLSTPACIILYVAT